MHRLSSFLLLVLIGCILTNSVFAQMGSAGSEVRKAITQKQFGEVPLLLIEGDEDETKAEGHKSVSTPPYWMNYQAVQVAGQGKGARLSGLMSLRTNSVLIYLSLRI